MSFKVRMVLDDAPLRGLLRRLEREAALGRDVEVYVGEDDKARWAEEGTATSPPRPFFRPGLAAARPRLAALYRRHAEALLRGGSPSLAPMGEAVEASVRASLDAVSAPPLAPATAAAKGHNKPLVDTGALRASIRWRFVGR
jgi:hypothetical protein